MPETTSNGRARPDETVEEPLGVAPEDEDPDEGQAAGDHAGRRCRGRQK